MVVPRLSQGELRIDSFVSHSCTVPGHKYPPEASLEPLDRSCSAAKSERLSHLHLRMKVEDDGYCAT